MAWERYFRIRFGSRAWTVWRDRTKKAWNVTLDTPDGVSVEPRGPGFASRKEAEKDIAQEIGGQIRDLRLALGLSQEELAARLGVRAFTISRWERGEQLPSKSALEKFNEAGRGGLGSRNLGCLEAGRLARSQSRLRARECAL